MDTNKKIALLLFAKGVNLPAFLANLSAVNRRYALEIMNELHPIGPSLYALWLTAPGKFAERMGEAEISRLETLANLARRQIALDHAEFDDILPPGFSVDTGDMSVITFDVDRIRSDTAQADQDPKGELWAPKATPTTNLQTLEQVRRAGLTGLN